jgi:hypothetical protein
MKAPLPPAPPLARVISQPHLSLPSNNPLVQNHWKIVSPRGAKYVIRILFVILVHDL